MGGRTSDQARVGLGRIARISAVGPIAGGTRRRVPHGGSSDESCAAAIEFGGSSPPLATLTRRYPAVGRVDGRAGSRRGRTTCDEILRWKPFYGLCGASRSGRIASAGGRNGRLAAR